MPKLRVVSKKDTTIIALLLSYKVFNTTKLRTETIDKYDKLVNQNLTTNNIFLEPYTYKLPKGQKFYSYETDRVGNTYAILNTAIKEEYPKYFMGISFYALLAAEQNNALATLDLELESNSKKIVRKDKTKTLHL